MLSQSQRNETAYGNLFLVWRALDQFLLSHDIFLTFRHFPVHQLYLSDFDVVYGLSKSFGQYVTHPCLLLKFCWALYNVLYTRKKFNKKTNKQQYTYCGHIWQWKRAFRCLIINMLHPVLHVERQGKVICYIQCSTSRGKGK